MPVRRKNATDVLVCTEGEGHRVTGDGGSVQGLKELKEALRDEGLDKEQWEQRPLFEQASMFDPTGCCNGREIGPKAYVLATRMRGSQR